MNNKILIIHKGQFDHFPPLLSLKSAFNSLDYNVDVLTSKNDSVILFGEKEQCFEIKRSSSIPILSFFVWYFKFLLKIRKLIKQDYKYIWIEGGDTLALFGLFINPIRNKSEIILQISELYDALPLYKFFIGKSINKFRKIVIPEINRAYIFKIWFKLHKTPYILPNKPNYWQIKKSEVIDKDSRDVLLKTKLFAGKRKVILYQGVIANDRKFEGVVKFVQNNDDYCLILLGKDIGYLNEINIDKNSIYYAGFLTPPFHMEVTKIATICLMAYDTTSLNKIYCAPNKIWEYSQWSKPIISQYLPGIDSIFNKYKFGICCDVSDEKSVSIAAKNIEKDYLSMEKNARVFFESFDYNRQVKNILEDL
ncbi:glycosyltransferase family 4 protein [Bizionia saleffrena]|uniref:Glycosyltransferase family 4 protein n=1 Tax=Bizionia saleffrena TaxID=291189 RepID=A0A8H2LC11_9FLAO|nr:glycosyltransferase family 4 protein [Bizionia saleffrena]TYB69457.1 glycosyltransferase family 4 protein [Bizionia saleffrena]